ncbi:DNA cytosine methyltransferase [Mesomycoplasma hyorhinis]|uniref:DNA cytosine methyltransferase n=1 Tax=Mesomycoplasma hyorhinis TaxID=2100 RepID=UPI001368AE6F|nr:DNA (cytosine-5-)-methyltransferase [Mesomycoplasma hyorhinis]MXR57777.1 DNA (cytosine-5-)-methyltransferase [Mesomycoplasma hyorhinis]
MKIIKIATVFSGIGAVEFALKRLGIKHKIIFACDNGERDITYDIQKEKKIVFSLKNAKQKKKYVDLLYEKNTRAQNYVQQSYLANYKLVKKDNFFQDIILLDGKDFENEVDLFVGGSPCQSFSFVGSQGGLEDARGTLFYEFARLVKQIQPKVFIYENVRNLLNHDNGKTWKIIKNIFDSLGYNYKYEVLNSSNFGIPQTRRRLFVVGYRKDLEFNFSFPSEMQDLKFKMKDFTINHCKEGYFTYNKKGEIVIKKLKGTVDEKYILGEKIYNYVMNSGTKTWRQTVKINLDIARTLLKTMGNRHRAGVDNYVSFDGTEKLGSVRMLTEREAHRLMGFTDDYKIVVSRSQAYKQAGNSIVVDVLMVIIKSIIETKVFERGGQNGDVC